uniref:ARAD1B20130p n=1 Tax=Blastobotrys adeninivorans TaxID=409370 RepID=A0A060TC42_BLAAD
MTTKRSKYFKKKKEDEESSSESQDSYSDASYKDNSSSEQSGSGSRPQSETEYPESEDGIKVKRRRTDSQVSTPEREDYSPGSMNPKSLKFLELLKDNNNREWFNENKHLYDSSRKDYESFIDELVHNLTQYDTEVPELPVKDFTFRLYRDVRFSHDKTPYKTHYASVFSRTGKKGPFAGYYITISGESCRIGAGYFPFGDRDTSQRKFQVLRDEIAQDSSRFKSRLTKIQRNSGDAIFTSSHQNEQGIIEEFLAVNEFAAMKRCPAGYEKTHPDVKLLMLKSFIIRRDIDLQILYKEGGAMIVAKLMAEMTPWVSRFCSSC